MKKTLATTAALLAFLGTAYAASVQGTIQAVDEMLTQVRKRRLSKPPVKL